MNRNLLALVLVVVAVGLYVTVTQSFVNQAQTISAQNDQYKTALANAAQFVNIRDQILAQYNAISANDRNRLDEMIPSTVDNIRLMVDLNAVAARDGLILSNLSASVPDDSSGAAAASAPAPVPTGPIGSGGDDGSDLQLPPAPVLDTVTVGFSTKATYDQFKSFLQDIESDLRIMDLTSLTVTSADNGTYGFTAMFTTYWLRQ